MRGRSEDFTWHPTVFSPTRVLQVNETPLVAPVASRTEFNGGILPPTRFLFRLAFFFFLSLSSEGSRLCLGIIYWHVVPTPLLFFFSSSPPHSSHYSPSFTISAAFHHPSPASTNTHPSPPPPSLLSISFCLSLSLHLFSPCRYLIFCCSSHSPSLNVTSIFSSSQFNFLSSPLLSSCHPAILFSRPHSHVDLFRGGPRRDRRGGGCNRLHPALPPHRPRQIPHQTQRSTAHTLDRTDMHGCAHACMHERTPRYTCINMDTCVPRQALTPTSMHMQGHTAMNSYVNVDSEQTPWLFCSRSRSNKEINAWQ